MFFVIINWVHRKKVEKEKEISNKLTCTCSEENDYVGFESETLIFHYDKDWKKIESVDFEIAYEVSDENIEDFDHYKEELDDICTSQKADKCNVTTDDNKISLNATSKPEDFGFVAATEKDVIMKQLLEDVDADSCTCK